MERRIVTGLDGSPTSHAVWQFAVDEATVGHAHLQVVHAYRGPPGARFDGYTSPPSWPSRHFLEDQALMVLDHIVGAPSHDGVERIVTPENPAEALRRIGEHADLLVIGSRDRHGLGRLHLGAVGRNILRHPPCPVVVVPVTGQPRNRAHRRRPRALELDRASDGGQHSDRCCHVDSTAARAIPT